MQSAPDRVRRPAPVPLRDELGPDVRAALRRRLEAERDALLRRAVGASEREATDRLDPLDPLAQHVLDLDRDLEVALDDARVRDVLEPIIEALDRLDDGTYGLCVDCRRPIGSARLLALPHARRCLGCQDACERPRR